MKMRKVIGAVLTLSLLGSSFNVVAEENPFSGEVWIAGDSIASDHSENREGNKRPLVGWGEVFGDYLEDVQVHNEARSGRSSKSYTKESNYETIMEEMGKGDVFFIQFGHNDEKADNKKLYTDPEGAADVEGSFKYYLTNYYIEPALEVGAYPVLLSSVARYEVEDGKLADQRHKAYKEAMEELVAEYEAKGITIPYIDCQSYTVSLYEADIEGAAAYHAMTGTGEDAELDRTHYCEMGARNLSIYILNQCASMNLYLNKNITGFAVIHGTLYEESKEKNLFDWVVAA